MVGLTALALSLIFLSGASVVFAGSRGERLAKDILRSAGVKGGLVVHLGCGSGKLTAALRANERYVVHGLDSDAADVKKARKYIRSQGLYGPVSVERLEGKRLPYAENLVNLVVTRKPLSVPMSEIMRVLCPNGVVYVNQSGNWTKKVKPWPKDIDEWSHYLHGPDNNAVAKDTEINPPTRMQWKSDPMWCRSHDGVASSIATMVSAAGRLFYVLDEGMIGQPKLPNDWTLVARDAFNGVLLWKRDRTSTKKRTLVASGDRLYTTLGHRAPLAVLDAATGETIRTCDETGYVDEIVSIDGIVVVRARNEKKQRRSAGKGQYVLAVNPENGRVLWDQPVSNMLGTSLAASDGRVFYHTGNELVALDLQDGKELWRTEDKAGRRDHVVVYGGAALVASGHVEAFAVEDGKRLWKGMGNRSRGGKIPGLFGAQGLVWTAWSNHGPRTFLWEPVEEIREGIDPRTGKVKRKVSAKRLVTPGHHIRCYPPKATENYLLLNKRGVEFFDLQGENHMRHNWLRAPCRHGMFPANGLTYMPPHQCFCYPGAKLNGFNVMSSGEVQESRTDEERLVRGPAYGDVDGEQAGAGDWPIYRHDPRRSGCTDVKLAAQLDRKWETNIKGGITPPVVANGRLFVAEENANTVHCLNAGSGKKLWSYVAGGRVDSPPTIHEGMALFGSADGRVHCLRASDGKLVWRFLAAPTDRRVMAFGRLESAWPVHGSVVVQDGKVYFTAGRSSYLDGGMYAYALDPKTGELLHKNRVWSGRPNVEEDAGRPFDMEGTRTDLLVSDGEDLYLFHARFGPDLKRKSTPRITKLGDRKVSPHLMCNDAFVDKTWFDRSYWTYGDRWPGYYFAYNAPKSGQILVFDDETTYGLHVFTERRGHSPMHKPGSGGYELFADDNDNQLTLRPTAAGREKGSGYSRAMPPKWSKKIPIRAQALVLAGDRLFLAGPPDVVPKNDPMASFEGRKGARMWAVDASNGKKLAEYKLKTLPAFDGMIAAEGRLYLCTADGRVICMGK